jgi:cell division protein FtsN
MKEAGTPPQNGKADKNTVFLHVSSFQEKEHAEKEVKRFTDSGLEAFIKEEMIDNRYWFRVYLGGFADEKKAREAAEGLKERGIISYFKPMRLDKPGSNQ